VKGEGRASNTPSETKSAERETRKKEKHMKNTSSLFLWTAALSLSIVAAGETFPKPYGPPCTERENVFEFTEKPQCKYVGDNKYEITFAVKGNCDVTGGIIDEKGRVVRHVGSGVLGANAPAPFQKNSLKQKIYWDGKDDLDDYPRRPEALRLQVRLGLKPVFDKRLGGTSPKNLPGTVQGLVAAPDGVYIFWNGTCGGFGVAGLRKYDRDGNYVETLTPPPSSLPESKLGGMGFVEYEPGKKAVHGPNLTESVAAGTFFFPPLDTDAVQSSQPVYADKRVWFANPGFINGSPGSFLHYVYADGARDERGVKGIVLAQEKIPHRNQRLAVSPDGKKIYLSGTGIKGSPSTCVFVRALDGDKPAERFAGEPGKPGSAEGRFNGAEGIDCDAEGRVYVADVGNNRVQIFAPDGKLLKVIPLDRPNLLQVHKKTGAIYVLHAARVEGRSLSRLSKLKSFAEPNAEFHVDGLQGLFTLDSWTAKPRLWFGGRIGERVGHAESTSTNYTGVGSVTIWEERDGKLVKLADFKEESLQQAGKSWCERWNGVPMHILSWGTLVCDPNREKAYYRFKYAFDLASGQMEGLFQPPGGCFQDVGFDKRGFMHGHQNPRAGIPCVWRVDPSQVKPQTDKDGAVLLPYPEVPYDYGVELKTGGWVVSEWQGALATKCQAGAKGFQDGMGVNMKGDVVVSSNIFYVPKMEEAGQELGMAGPTAWKASGQWNEGGGRYDAFIRSIKDAEKKGESVYYVKREPGIPLTGATMWTFDNTGELRNESPAAVGGLVAGMQIDEDGFTYVVMDRTRRVEGKDFLAGRAGHFGGAPNATPFTGTLARTRVEKLKVQLKNAIIPMDKTSNRPPDFSHPEGWVEGVEWLYAGASPIVPGGCSCPSSRFYLDWYKRTFVPESYRHSVGILDANGNLIMHLGKSANFDSAPGGKNGAKPGGTDIGFTAPRYISGTDNYLVMPDWGEKITVLKLDYHAEEIVPVKTK
jgi:hypothetical protein